MTNNVGPSPLLNEALPIAAMPALALTPKGQLMRARLLAAGGTAFAEYGYERTRVADVARIAGTSHGNFYRHFKDKSGLLHGVLQQLYETLARSTARAPGSRSVPTEAELVRRNIAFFHLYAEHRHLLRVAREAAAQGASGEFLDYWLQMRRIFTDRTALWLQRLIDDAQVQPGLTAEMAAEALGAMTEQLAYVQVGLVAQRPRPERLDVLGHACGVIWYRTLFADVR